MASDLYRLQLTAQRHQRHLSHVLDRLLGVCPEEDAPHPEPSLACGAEGNKADVTTIAALRQKHQDLLIKRKTYTSLAPYPLTDNKKESTSALLHKLSLLLLKWQEFELLIVKEIHRQHTESAQQEAATAEISLGPEDLDIVRDYLESLE